MYNLYKYEEQDGTDQLSSLFQKPLYHFDTLEAGVIWMLNFRVICNRNGKLKISIASTKAKSREPAYSQALVQNKTIGSWSYPESQAGRQSDGYGGWCLELRWGGR